MFVAQNLGKQYIKLALVNDTEVREDVMLYDGEDTHLLGNYTLADDAYDSVVDFASIADKVDSVEVVETLAVHGGGGGTRCYANLVSVLVLEDGTMWMDEALHDNIFC